MGRLLLFSQSKFVFASPLVCSSLSFAGLYIRSNASARMAMRLLFGAWGGDYILVFLLHAMHALDALILIEVSLLFPDSHWVLMMISVLLSRLPICVTASSCNHRKASHEKLLQSCMNENKSMTRSHLNCPGSCILPIVAKSGLRKSFVTSSK